VVVVVVVVVCPPAVGCECLQREGGWWGGIGEVGSRKRARGREGGGGGGGNETGKAPSSGIELLEELAGGIFGDFTACPTIQSCRVCV
jgi:hypothetical protein